MNADDLTRTMRAALDAEREGIRRLDHVAVARATKAKEAIIAGLLATPASERRPLLDALNAFQADLRENLILLAHARAYLLDASELSRTPEGRAQLEAKHGVVHVNVNVKQAG